MEDFGLYLVMTNPAVGYAKCAEAAVRAGVGIVQLRMKHASREEILREAREVRLVTAGTSTLFIVNDDPDARVMPADCIPYGNKLFISGSTISGDIVNDDVRYMKPSEVRARFPGLKIVGLSTHNLAQVEASLSEPVDYIGVGPVYATPTKNIPDPTLGPEMAGRMIAAANVPAVAIGGLNLETLPPVLAVGAKNFAVVRAVCGRADPEAAMRELMSAAGLS